MIRQFLNNRWFSFFDLACVSASCLIWFLSPQSGWWPLVIALFPWLLRLGAGQFPFQRTPFDLPLIIFLLTAALGVWVSYNFSAAWSKFWLITGSILIFNALAGQPQSNLFALYGWMGIVGSVVALSLLFDTNLGNYQPDLGLVQRFSQWWESVRPAWRVDAMPPNVSGGILAVLLPFPLISLSESFRKGRIFSGLTILLPVLVMTLALFLSSSRGAWIAASVACFTVLAWVTSRMFLGHLSRSLRIILVSGFLLTIVIVAGLFINSSGGLTGAMDRMPGLPSGASRVDLIRDTISLSADFPFTGGGLSAFPGLYSKYILIIPYLFFEYSHNLYLDVFLEQGLLGGLALVIVLLGSLLLVITRLQKIQEIHTEALLHLAVLAGLIVLMVHGLVDDALYGMRGTPLLFLIPGISVALGYPGMNNRAVEVGRSPVVARGLVWGSAILGILVVTAIGLIGNKPVTASWLANLGSIHMAKAELHDFPSNSFDYLPEEGPLEQAKTYFGRALAANPMNVTANYRLGLIASQETDFQTAIPYLEKAFLGNNRHRGIQKVLGYNYAWTGQPDLAAEMLVEIPEARQELEAYIWWWAASQRPDLAAHSESALKQLAFPQ
jgi:putative inorganic carbon (hco3(-)) transporter